MDDLEALPADRWITVSHEAIVADPRTEIARICSAMDFAWDRVVQADLPLSRHTYTRPAADKWRAHETEIERTRSIWGPENDRARARIMGSDVRKPATVAG
jgi:hypothetical protein